MRGMAVEVRGLFDHVEILVMLPLFSSAETERSFSPLRRKHGSEKENLRQKCCCVFVYKPAVNQICQQVVSTGVSMLLTLQPLFMNIFLYLV